MLTSIKSFEKIYKKKRFKIETDKKNNETKNIEKLK